MGEMRDRPDEIPRLLQREGEALELSLSSQGCSQVEPTPPEGQVRIHVVYRVWLPLPRDGYSTDPVLHELQSQVPEGFAARRLGDLAGLS